MWVVKNEYVKKRYDWWWGYMKEQIKIIRKGMSPQIFEQEYNCFIGGTDIITMNGVKNIENVEVGDHVLTHTNRYRKVLKKFERIYNGDIYKIHSFVYSKKYIQIDILFTKGVGKSSSCAAA